MQLGRHRAFTHARGVRLHHAEHAVNHLRAHAQARAHAADRGIRRCHERIGTVIDIEQRALRPLEQNRPARCARPGQEQRHVVDPRLHPLAVGEHLVEQRTPVERRILDEPVAGLHVLADLLLEPRPVEQIAHADATPADLVLVGRADAARGGADLALAAPGFGQQIELAVIRQNQMRPLADEQAVAHVVSEGSELVDLGKERLRIDDDPVADGTRDVRMQNARRQEPKNDLRLRRRRRCGPRCARPGSVRRRQSAASADRRLCPCLHPPTARRVQRCS